MKTGKLAENAWKRSVLKQRRTKRDEVRIGAGIGEDCAVFSLGDGSLTAVSVCPVAWNGDNAALHAVHGAINAVAVSGAEPVAVTFSLFLPEQTQEPQIRAMTARMEEVCAALHVQTAADAIRITDAVKYPLLSVSGIGRLDGREALSVKNIKPGQDVVAGKWIGLEGTSLLARAKEKELLTKYPFRFIEEAKGFDRFLSIVPEAATAVKSGVCAMHGVTEGGIFGALWELAEGAGVGLEIDWKEIPVRQETIEVCEFFELNPYELLSGGCLLMASDNGYDLVRALEREHIPAAVIGKTTDNNDRVVINGEERRFLGLPKPDAVYQVLGQQ